MKLPHFRDDSDDDDPLGKPKHDDSGGGGGGGGGRGPMAGEQELATKMLQIQSKRFYLDVKQNRRGRFIKIAEVGAGGRKSRLLMSMPVAVEFRDYLTEFGDLYASLGPPGEENIPEDGRIKSELMVRDNRRYYLDLKQNNRGRFLRVSQTISRMTGSGRGMMMGGPQGPGSGRSQIAVPAQGIVELRDALTELLEEFFVPGEGDDSGEFRGELPEGKQFRVENKMFYFDMGQNNRGVFMRVSEVKSNFRTAITIPERSWPRFRDIFIEICDKMEKIEETGGSGTGGQQASDESAESPQHHPDEENGNVGDHPDEV